MDKSRVWMMMATTTRSVMNLVDLNHHASHIFTSIRCHNMIYYEPSIYGKDKNISPL